MSEHCETVGALLGLYAEGELHDPRTVELVREHLRDCVDCRDALDSYDRLTRALLAGEPESLPEGGDGWIDLERERRVEGVMRRLGVATRAAAGVDGSPVSRGTGSSGAGPPPGPAASGRCRRSTP